MFPVIVTARALLHCDNGILDLSTSTKAFIVLAFLLCFLQSPRNSPASTQYHTVCPILILLLLADQLLFNQFVVSCVAESPKPTSSSFFAFFPLCFVFCAVLCCVLGNSTLLHTFATSAWLPNSTSAVVVANEPLREKRNTKFFCGRCCCCCIIVL